MDIGPRRLRDKAQRRNSIITAAERVFFSKSLESATMDEVAEAAHISKGLLYVYFENKEDLYNAVTLRGMRLLYEAFERAVAGPETGLRKVRAIGEAYVTFAREHPHYFSSIVYQAAQTADADAFPYAAACEAERDRLINAVAEALRTGIADGSIRADLDPMQSAIVLWGQMHGVIQVAVIKNIQAHYGVDFEALIQSTFGFITTALRPPASGS